MTKIDAARIAASAGIPVVLTTAEQAEAALAGHDRGHVFFHPTGRRRPTRLLWLRHASDPAARSFSMQEQYARSPSAMPRCSQPALRTCAANFPLASRWSWSEPDGSVVARGLVSFTTQTNCQPFSDRSISRSCC